MKKPWVVNPLSFNGAILSILTAMVPARVRYTALSVSQGRAVVLFGGSRLWSRPGRRM